MTESFRRLKQMGSEFTYGVMAESQVQGDKMLELAIGETNRIEELLSEFKPNSDTSRINREACHRPVRLSSETFALIKRCQAISQLTDGDFDITAGAIKSLYPFRAGQNSLPAPSQIQATLAKTGFKYLELDEQNECIRFTRPGMKINFAAIGKGYASDQVKKLWQYLGVDSGFINASGDLNAFGLRTDGSHWKIGVANPEKPGSILCYVDLENTAAATSGDYEQFFQVRNKRFSHTINPHTGLPLTSMKSVTIISPSAELSDALATAVTVRGAKKGTEFINQLPNTYSICFDRTHGVIMSKDIRYETVTG